MVLLVIGTIFAEKYDLYWSRVGFITVMHVLFLVFTSIALLAGWIASHCCKSFLLSIVEVSVMVGKNDKKNSHIFNLAEKILNFAEN